MTSAVLAVRQDELERAAQLDRLREVCRARGINVEVLNYPLKKCIAYFTDIPLIIIANNYKGVQAKAMTNFIIQASSN